MGLDIDIIKTRAKGNFRLSKVRGECIISVRVPGGIMPAHLLSVAQNIAEKYGNGIIHLTTRQKLGMPGIKYEDIPKVNKDLEPFLKDITVDLCGINVEDTKAGYQTLAGRNIVACMGNRICQKANIDTTGLARRFERHVYPQKYHLKIVIAGCPNDCAKANISDFGILGVTKINFKKERCIGCGACVKACKSHAVDCLYAGNGKAKKYDIACIGCGECILACPTLAWQRDEKQFYMVKLGGRTSKKTPRLGKTFLHWVTEDVMHKVIDNLFEFQAEMLDGKPVYLHMGHLIDVAGYKAFKKRVLKDVDLNPEALVADRIYWSEDEYIANMHLRPISQ